MTVQQSALRCKDGDLALVINDTIACRQNIGRVVQVRGPVRKLKQSGMQGWRIKPIHKRIWGVTELDGQNVKELVFWRSWVFHEDAWLMPIRPQQPDEVWLEVHRAANGKPWMHPDMPGIVAVASDTPPPYDLPRAGLDEVEAIADLVLAHAREIKDIPWTEG